MSGAPEALDPPAPIWDPLVRLTHWGIALGVLSNAALTTGGKFVHVSIGWVVLGLLALRLAWGLVGPAEARFGAFPPNPRAAIRHLGELLRGRVSRYPSHNPAGALMVYAFWATLMVVILTGIGITGTTPLGVARREAAIAQGDWSVIAAETPLFSTATSDVLKLVHPLAGNLLLVLAALHVLGVFVESRAMRVNLVRPMIRGRRQRARDVPPGGGGRR